MVRQVIGKCTNGLTEFIRIGGRNSSFYSVIFYIVEQFSKFGCCYHKYYIF